MNPLTNVRNVQKLNEKELELGLTGKKSWHDQYKDSAWVFIGGLPYDLTEGDVICVFSQYGEIVNINMVRDKQTGKTKGYAFLCYEDQRSTVLAVDNLNGFKLLGRTLRVDHVEGYRKPKEHGDEDEITMKIRQEGCAPSLPSSEEEEEPLVVPHEKIKKEKHKKSKKKKNKKEKKKHKADSSSDSEDERSNRSRDSDLPIKTKKGKEYPVYGRDEKGRELYKDKEGKSETYSSKFDESKVRDRYEKGEGRKRYDTQSKQSYKWNDRTTQSQRDEFQSRDRDGRRDIRETDHQSYIRDRSSDSAEKSERRGYTNRDSYRGNERPTDKYSDRQRGEYSERPDWQNDRRGRDDYRQNRNR